MNEKFMEEAIALSRNGMEGNEGGPFGAVIVKAGKVIGRGNNQVLLKKDCTAHAEMVAIREACHYLHDFNLSGCELYTSCEPCPMCFSAALWARVDAIYYAATRRDAAKIGFDDSFFYEQVGLPINKREVTMQQMQRKAAVDVFDGWEKKVDKTHY